MTSNEDLAALAIGARDVDEKTFGVSGIADQDARNGSCIEALRSSLLTVIMRSGDVRSGTPGSSVVKRRFDAELHLPRAHVVWIARTRKAIA